MNELEVALKSKGTKVVNKLDIEGLDQFVHLYQSEVLTDQQKAIDDRLYISN